MSNVDRLLALFDAGILLRPSADVPNTVDLARAIARVNGDASVPVSDGATGTIIDQIGGSDHHIFVLVDGLGMSLLETLPESAFLRRRLVLELRAVFPSTTSAALTTLATGEWPGRHGIIGWWTHIAEMPGPATILPFTHRVTGAPLGNYGVTEQMAFPTPSRARNMERSVVAVLPQSVVRSVYSGYSVGRGFRRGYGTVTEAVDRVLQRVAAAAGPSYTYLYLPQIDSAAHTSGTGSDETRTALAEVNGQLERLAEGLAAMDEGRAKLVISADHGHLDADPPQPVLVREGDEIGRMLRYPPAGDARVSYFHVRDDAIVRFEVALNDLLGDSAVLLMAEEFLGLELLGPGGVTDLTRARVGDYVAISTGATVFAWTPEGTDRPELSRLVSHHSGLTPQEMRIPLIVDG